MGEAAGSGVKRALGARSKNPLLIVQGTMPGKEERECQLAGLLGALAALYVPLEMREVGEKEASKVDGMGWAGEEKVMNHALAIEKGRVVARDIGGTDPERMAAPKVEEYVQEVFKGTKVKVEVMKGQQFFESEYPCLAAVNRCASTIPRHDGRLIWLTYEGEGSVKKTVYLVGKGITYDTGGADIKAGGVMAGMSRDECGAAAAAGLMKTLAEIQPANIKVVAALCMVRNSVGANSYVADEIITSRAGVRLRVGNTDAEGRMAMADPLHHTLRQALTETNPHIYTVATLTGHAVLAMGHAYSIAMDNGPARGTAHAQTLQEMGHVLGDPWEVSTIRREDYDFVAARNEYEDVLQCNNLPSSRTPRGHQFPAAFMIRASGLDQYGVHADTPVKYTHIDIAGSSGQFPGIPTAAPLLTLAKNIKAF